MTHNRWKDVQIILLRNAIFCTDCEIITNDISSCPVCDSSLSLFPLARWLEDVERSRENERLTIKISENEC